MLFNPGYVVLRSPNERIEEKKVDWLEYASYPPRAATKKINRMKNPNTLIHPKQQTLMLSIQVQQTSSNVVHIYVQQYSSTTPRPTLNAKFATFPVQYVSINNLLSFNPPPPQLSHSMKSMKE